MSEIQYSPDKPKDCKYCYWYQYFEQLRQSGALEPVTDHAGILLNPELYNPGTGLPFQIPEQSQAFFI